MKGRMGKLFPLKLFSGTFSLLILAGFDPCIGQIEMMPPPVRVLPPELSEEAKEEELLRLKNRRKEKTTPKKSPFQWQVDQQKKKLQANAHAEHQYRLMLKVSLVYPFIQVSGPRKNYTTEITSHVWGAWRMKEAFEADTLQTWVGFRVAPFSGTGQYQETVGRYGYMYVGPMAGLGKIGTPETSRLTHAGTANDRQVPVGSPVRHGWMLMAGLAVQSREGEYDPTDDFTSKDLDTTRGFRLDAPGLWVELSWFTIHYGQLGLHWTAGIQTGEGKNFFWVGTAMGGWL